MGSFELDCSALRFGPVAAAHRGDEAMAHERALLGTLEATRRYAIEGTSLTLLDDERVLARLETATAVAEFP